MADQPTIITAPCPVCGASRFEAPGGAPRLDDILTCQSCGTKLSYGFLQARHSEPAQPVRPKVKKPRNTKRAARKARRK